MEISLRDDNRGQALIEYLLVLIVAVAIILGGIYQLNSAFKVWAENYFGNYLSCLLETGELPTIGGNPGDSGLCNSIFKPFSLEDGRPLAVKGSEGGGSANTGNGSGAVESGGGGGGGGGSSFNGGRFTGGGGAYNGGKGSTNKMKGKSDGQYTGSTATADYGGGYGATNRRLSTQTKTRLDNQFAFDDSKEKQTRRGLASSAAPKKEATDTTKKRVGVNGKENKKDSGEQEDSGFSISDFIRYLIIACIILALVIFLGGQMLQVGKSME